MDAVIFFDIRNFSAHRQLLGLTKSAKPLSVLVIDLLEKAVMLGNSLVPRFGIEKLPLLNHTGDGFVIVLQGGRACLAALTFASEFREFAEVKLATYQSRFDKCHEDAEPETKLPSKLDYGMGVHCGSVTPLKYKSFRGTRMIFLGSAVNIASRVEGCTKDHPHAVLCTEQVYSHARADLEPALRPQFKKCFSSLGKHNLRGLHGPVTLFVCEPRLQNWLRLNLRR